MGACIKPVTEKRLAYDISVETVETNENIRSYMGKD
jgi:hypothetical protein